MGVCVGVSIDVSISVTVGVRIGVSVCVSIGVSSVEEDVHFGNRNHYFILESKLCSIEF